MKLWQTGDAMEIRTPSACVSGSVLLASANGKSLMLGFEAILENHVGTMPVLLDDDGVYRSIVNQVEVTLTEKAAPP